MDCNIRKILLGIHQYSGLISGLPVFIICLTGSLYVFRTEITDIFISYGFNTDDIDDTFEFIIDGHQFFWLPCYFGRLLVTFFVMIYLIALLSGIILWLPKHFNAYSFHWHKHTHKWQFIIETHILLGIYFLLPITLLCIIGVIYGLGGIDNAEIMKVVGIIHRGQFWGLTGKILMLLASLIGATLAVTGYIITLKRYVNHKKQINEQNFNCGCVHI